MSSQSLFYTSDAVTTTIKTQYSGSDIIYNGLTKKAKRINCFYLMQVYEKLLLSEPLKSSLFISFHQANQCFVTGWRFIKMKVYEALSMSFRASRQALCLKIYSSSKMKI